MQEHSVRWPRLRNPLSQDPDTTCHPVQTRYRKATAKTGAVKSYNQLAGKAAQFDLLDAKSANMMTT
jgi:hypothetical protein